MSPIFKKRARSSPGNYRPVSLTAVVFKVMKALIRDAILNHVLSNNLLSKYQHGHSYWHALTNGLRSLKWKETC